MSVPSFLVDLSPQFLRRFKRLSPVPADWKLSEGHDPLQWQAVSPDGLQAQGKWTVDKERKVAVLRATLTNPGREQLPLGVVCLSGEISSQGTEIRAWSAAGGAQNGEYPPVGCFRGREVLIEESYWIGSRAGARSSDFHMPFGFFAEDEGNGDGMWMGMEWSGLWNQSLGREPNGDLSLNCVLGLGTGQGFYVLDSEFWIQPGEIIELPAVHIGFFNRGFEEGTNALRRYLRDVILPPIGHEKPLPHLAYDHWFGLGLNLTEKSIGRQIDRSAALGLEYFILDAGWWEGAFPSVGNWAVNKERFPSGLKHVGDMVRSRGMKFGIFFEPERAARDCDWVKNYPELYLDSGYSSLVLNFGLTAAQDLIIDFTSKLIRENEIKWIRWDLNCDMGPYWRDADPTGRVQLGYGKGLDRVLGELRKAFPDCVHENCASGGRRIDLALLRHAQSAWINDTTFSANLCRFIQLGANRLLPAHLCASAVAIRDGAGDGGITDYDILSRMAGSLLFSGDIASWSDELTKRVSGMVQIYKQYRHLLREDYYRLLPPPVGIDDWDAGQFVNDQSESLVFVFRPCKGDEEIALELKELREGSYRVLKLLGMGSHDDVLQVSRDGKADLKVGLPSRGAVLLHLTPA